VYTLEDPLNHRYFRASVKLDLAIDPDPFLRGITVIEGPLILGWAHGREIVDVVWTTDPAIVVVSAPVVSAFEAHGFTGWTTYPVELRNRASESVEGYSGFAVTGRCGPTDDSRGRWVQTDKPGAWHSVLQGLYFDETQWDGSDIFMAPHVNYIFVTEPVKKLLRKLKVKNVLLERLTEFQIPEAVIRGGLPDDVH
jgi:hypothetical protein